MQRKKLYCVFSPKTEQNTLHLLKEACLSLDVEYVPVTTDDFDYGAVPKVTKKDLLYRAAASDRDASKIERLLLVQGITSFYTSLETGMAKLGHVIEASMIHEYARVPVIPTIYGLSHNKAILQKNVETLGGFPIVIKVTGGSHGIGVIKMDSLSSLYSVVDYLHTKKEDAVLKKFLHVTSSARLIVLGQAVIDSIEYSAPKDDFRSNEGGSPNVVMKKFPKAVENTAVKAAQSLGWEFAGVDILTDKGGNHYVAEVNFPCYFPRCQELSGIDIAGKMIKYLIKKSQKR